ncbi:ribosome biogenesis protein NOP53 [Microplitis demolitor]|uniref:ribosome biogenesis protein NOP53 n=1 Tax=Microplitis demolitor TaxID=69319 RepID=UPI0004CD042A|nr:ribosome biogenesis protein NOP53 [Microplitis demolitor]
MKIITESEGVKKRKRVSKKNKISWRKNIDIQDVDDFLEDKRLEERLGKPFSKRTAAELFTVDTKPDDKLGNLENVPEITSKAAYRLALRNSEPKCYSSLKSTSAVPDPIAKRNRVRTPEERKNPITRRIEMLRRMNGQLKLKERNAIENKRLAEAKRKSRPKRGEYKLDAWDITPEQVTEINSQMDTQWLSSDTIRHTLANKGLNKRKTPGSVHKKTSVLPAIEPPHPGMSYNPSFEDHQDLLRKVAEKEMKLIKEEKHLERVTTKMFKKVTPEQKEDNWLKESSEGLSLGDKEKTENEKNDDDDDDGVLKSINPPVKRKKKTLVQRRKQKEQRKLKLELKKGKMEKKKVSDLYRLKMLKKKIEVIEHKKQILHEKREKLNAKKALEPKVLSKTKYEEPELDFQMGHELTGNLRSTKPTTSLLSDRFKSLQQRSIVAPSKRVLGLNKAKVKKFIKADHRITMPKTKKNK